MTLTVDDADTAVSFRSGSVAVLATPRLIALCEEAAFAAVEDAVEAGRTTVGFSVGVDHLRPCAVGTEVTAKATLDRIEGRKLVFTVAVKDHRGLVAAGKITRVIVDLERFMEKTH